jgi:hypothetical protein
MESVVVENDNGFVCRLEGSPYDNHVSALNAFNQFIGKNNYGRNPSDESYLQKKGANFWRCEAGYQIRRFSGRTPDAHKALPVVKFPPEVPNTPFSACVTCGFLTEIKYIDDPDYGRSCSCADCDHSACVGGVCSLDCEDCGGIVCNKCVPNHGCEDPQFDIEE